MLQQYLLEYRKDIIVTEAWVCLLKPCQCAILQKDYTSGMSSSKEFLDECGAFAKAKMQIYTRIGSHLALLNGNFIITTPQSHNFHIYIRI